MTRHVIDMFMNQQIHAQGNVQLVAPIFGSVGTAVLNVALGDSMVEVHLHQASKVFAVRLTALGGAFSILNARVSTFHPDQTDRQVFLQDNLDIESGGVEVDLGGALTPIVRVRFTSETEGRLGVALVADTGYLNELARRTRVIRHVAALSLTNAKRRDNQFDSKYIQHGQLFETLAAEKPQPFTLREQSLFPKLQPRDRNLIGEKIDRGNAILVPLMNRNGNVEKNLPRWAIAGFDEIVLVDWASEVPVSSLPIVQKTENVRVIRVDGPKRYIRTWAMNLANRCVRASKVFKCDSDVEVRSNFLEVHKLQKEHFIVGDWRHARDFNERHLHGDVYYNLEDFDRVNGFDERIINYGQEDTNLTDRMILAGLRKQVLSYDTLHHQEHSNTQRGSNQNVVHPMVNTQYYRALCNYRSLWSRREASLFNAELEIVTPREIRFRVEDTYIEAEDAQALDSAIDMVAGWYSNDSELASLTAAAKLLLIWEKSVE